MNENAITLAELMGKHPELKVVAKVDEEIVADDSHSWWLGSIGDAEITSMYIDDERVWFEDDKEDLIEQAFDEIYNSIESETGLNEIDTQLVSKAAEKKVSEYDWEKVIAVNITTR